MGNGMTVAGGNTGLFLKHTMEFKMMITIIPGAPNNKAQFHVETVEAKDQALQLSACRTLPQVSWIYARQRSGCRKIRSRDR